MSSQRCSLYPKDSNCNACNTVMRTTPCDPNNKCNWFKHKLPQGLDPVLSNIYNGCWMCNYEPEQCWNSKLCDRNFFNGYVANPCQVAKDVDIESKMKHLGTRLNRNFVEKR